MLAFKVILLLTAPIALANAFGLPISLPKVTLPPLPLTLPPSNIPKLLAQFTGIASIDLTHILGATGSLSISAASLSLDGSVGVTFSIPNVQASSHCLSVLSNVIQSFGAVASFAGQASFHIGAPSVSLNGQTISLPCSFPNALSTVQFLNIVASAMGEINAMASSGASLTVGTPAVSVNGDTVSLPCSLPNIQDAQNALNQILANINACGALGGHGSISISAPVAASGSASFSLSLPNTQANLQFLNMVAALLANVNACGTCGAHVALPPVSLPNISIPTIQLPPINLPTIQLPSLQVNFGGNANIDISGMFGASASLSISAASLSLDGSVGVTFSLPNVQASSHCISVLSNVIQSFGAVALFAEQANFNIGAPSVSLDGHSISLPCSFPNIAATTQFLNIVADAMADVNAFASSGASLTVGTPSISADLSTVSLPCGLPSVQDAQNALNQILASINACGALGGHGSFSISAPVSVGGSALVSIALPNTQANLQFLNVVASLLANINACGTCGAHVALPPVSLPNISIPTIQLPTINLPSIQLPSLQVNFGGNANIDISSILGVAGQLSISGASLSIGGQSVLVSITIPNVGSSSDCMNVLSGVIGSLSAVASLGGQISIGLPSVSLDGHSISLPCSLPNIEASTDFLNIVADVFAEINALASFAAQGSIFVGGVSVDGGLISLPCTFPSTFLSVFQEIAANINGCLSLAGHASASIGAAVASGASLSVPLTLPNIPANVDLMGTIAASLHQISALGCGCTPSLPAISLPDIQIPSVSLPSIPNINVSGAVDAILPTISFPTIQLPFDPSILLNPSLNLELPEVCEAVQLPNIFANLMAEINAFVSAAVQASGSVSLSVGDISVGASSVSLPCTVPNVQGLIDLVQSIIGHINACAGSQFNLSIDSSVSADASLVTLTITAPDASSEAQQFLELIGNVLGSINACAALDQQVDLSIDSSSISVNGASVELPLTLPSSQDAINAVTGLISSINACASFNGHASFSIGAQVSVGGQITLPISIPCIQLPNIDPSGSIDGHISLPDISIPSISLPTISLPTIQLPFDPSILLSPSLNLELPGVCGAVQLPNIFANLMAEINAFVSAAFQASGSVSLSVGDISVGASSVSLPCTVPNVQGLIDLVQSIIGHINACAGSQFNLSIDSSVSADASLATLTIAIPDASGEAQQFLHLVSNVLGSINSCASLDQQVDLSIDSSSISVNGASVELPLTLPSSQDAINAVTGLISSINACASFNGNAGFTIGGQVSVGGQITLPISIPCIQLPNIDVSGSVSIPQLPNIDLSGAVGINLPSVSLPDVFLPNIHLPSLGLTLPCISASIDLPSIIADLMANINTFVQLASQLAGSVSLSVGDVSVNGASVTLPCTLPNVHNVIETVTSIIGNIAACAGSQFDLSIDTSVSVDASMATLTITVPNASAAAGQFLNILANILQEVSACGSHGQNINLSIDSSSVSVNDASVTLPLNLPQDFLSIFNGLFANINAMLSISEQASLDVGLPEVSAGAIATLPITISCLPSLPQVNLPDISLPFLNLPPITLPGIDASGSVQLPDIFTNVMTDISAFVSLEAHASVDLPCNSEALIASLQSVITSAMNSVHDLQQISVDTCGSSARDSSTNAPTTDADETEY